VTKVAVTGVASGLPTLAQDSCKHHAIPSHFEKDPLILKGIQMHHFVPNETHAISSWGVSCLILKADYIRRTFWGRNRKGSVKHILWLCDYVILRLVLTWRGGVAQAGRHLRIWHAMTPFAATLGYADVHGSSTLPSLRAGLCMSPGSPSGIRSPRLIPSC
jgi:hypothetical protein